MTMTKLGSILPTHPKIQKFLEARNLDRTMAEEYLRHKDIDKLLASHRLWLYAQNPYLCRCAGIVSKPQTADHQIRKQEAS